MSRVQNMTWTRDNIARIPCACGGCSHILSVDAVELNGKERSLVLDMPTSIVTLDKRAIRALEAALKEYKKSSRQTTGKTSTKRA